MIEPLSSALTWAQAAQYYGGNLMAANPPGSAEWQRGAYVQQRAYGDILYQHWIDVLRRHGGLSLAQAVSVYKSAFEPAVLVKAPSPKDDLTVAEVIAAAERHDQMLAEKFKRLRSSDD